MFITLAVAVHALTGRVCVSLFPFSSLHSAILLLITLDCVAAPKAAEKLRRDHTLRINLLVQVGFHLLISFTRVTEEPVPARLLPGLNNAVTALGEFLTC